jgi:hypothetical protein
MMIFRGNAGIVIVSRDSTDVVLKSVTISASKNVRNLNPLAALDKKP